VRLSAPALLTFDKLVELEKTDEPSAELAARLDQLLHTPFLSNEAFYGGAKPNRPLSETLGPFIRATMWNIERGIEFDGIRISLTEQDQFEKYIDGKKDPKSKPLSPEALTVVKNQLDILKPTDLFILNEVDNGVTRTDYRNVARDLAKALNMNYAYAVEFLELDPLNLGLEKVKLEDKTASPTRPATLVCMEPQFSAGTLSARRPSGPSRFATTGSWVKRRKSPSWNQASEWVPILPSWRESRARFAGAAERHSSWN